MSTGKILTRLHLCTVSPEPSKVTHPPFIVFVRREDFDESVLVHSLPWTFVGHQSSIYCEYEQGRFWRDCTCTQSPLNHCWSLILHLLCEWAGKILTRLHLRTVSPEPSLVTHPPFIVFVSREDSDKTVLVHSLPWTFVGHLSSIYSVWAGKNLTRLHLCTVSRKPSLVTHPPFIVFVKWEDSDETALAHSLPWAIPARSSSIFVYVSREDFDETALVHSLPWTFPNHPSSIFCNVSWEDSDETALVHCLPWTFPGHSSFIYCVYKQGRFWQDCICAHFPLNLRWPLIIHFCECEQRRFWQDCTYAHFPWTLGGHSSFIFCEWARKILTSLYLSTFSPEP